jgi:CRISPR type IV-associated protein Csf1
MLNISKIIVQAIENKKYDDVIEDKCCLCGIEKANKFENKKNILSKSFTDYNRMKYRCSEKICNYCIKLLNDDYMESPKGKRCGLRLYSYIVENNKFKIIDMSEKINYLFNYQFKIPFLLCFSKTGKKHIFYKAKLSYSKNNFWVCTEENNILFEREKYIEIYNIVNNLFQLGISKDELKSCIINIKKIYKFNIDFNNIIKIKKYKDNQCYELIIDCLVREKKNDSNN